MLSYICIGSQRPSLKYLNRHVVEPIASVWYNVGVELMKEEDVGALGVIKTTTDLDNEERTRRMLLLWLERETDASWNNLINALGCPSVKLYYLASQLQKMLIPESMYVAIYL